MDYAELSAAQRDVLWILADVGPASGTGVEHELDDHPAEWSMRRLSGVLDSLVERGYVAKRPAAGRGYRYELTADGRELLRDRTEWQRRRVG